FNNQRKDSIKIDFVASSKHRLAVRHTWAPNYWNDPEPFGVYSTIWDYPGRTLAAAFTSTLSNTLMNEASFSWGTTSPSKYFGQRNCDYCPGGTTRNVSTQETASPRRRRRPACLRTDPPPSKPRSTPPPPIREPTPSSGSAAPGPSTATSRKHRGWGSKTTRKRKTSKSRLET